MKKWLGFVAFLSLTITVYAVPYISPINYMEIPVCEEIMNINGDDTEGSWSAAQSFTLFNTGPWSGASDFSGYFKLCWDETYLYFYADITDDVNHSYDGVNGDSWMYDNIEIYIDLDTANHPVTEFDDNTVQLRFNRGFTSPQQSGRAGAGDYLYSYKEKTGGTGWIVEAGIPWTCALPSGSLPEDILAYVSSAMGFDANFADSDNSDGDPTVGNRDVQGTWDLDGGSEDNAWQNTSTFGIVDLLSEAYPPAIPYTSPLRTMNVPARTDRIVMDGVADEGSWSDIQDVTMFDATGYSGAGDFDAEFRLSWDMEYLYFFADITDDINHSYAGTDDVWMFDAFDIYLDLDTVMGTVDYDNNSILLRFNRGMNQVQEPGRAAKGDYKYYSENTSTGWVVEAGIPWTSAMPSGYLPEDFAQFMNGKMGMDVSFFDSDNSDGNPSVGNRDILASWDTDGLDGTEDNAWFDTHVFGIIDLIGIPNDPELELSLPYTEPVRDMDIPQRNQTFDLDAFTYETFWSYPQKLTVFNDTDYFGEDDLSCVFRTAWDMDYLYLYARILDDQDQSWTPGQPDAFNYDNVEVYIDLDTFSTVTAYRNTSTTMLRFNRGVDDVQETGRASAGDFQYTWRNLYGGIGWQMEAAIPWTCALATGLSSSDIEDYLPTIGLDVIVNDLDATTISGRENITQAAWDIEYSSGDPLEDLAMENTRVFGIANLSPYALEVSEGIREDFRIFPNPVADRLTIESDKVIRKLEILNPLGQSVMHFNGGDLDESINISDLPAGAYLIHCVFSDSSEITKFVMKE
jgi:hypothetical protein